MSEPRHPSDADRRRPSDLRDLIVIALVSVGAFALGISLGLFERVHTWLETSTPFHTDVAFVVLLTLVLAAGAVAVSRGRAAREEEALRSETERRYRAMVEHQPAITYTWDPSVPVNGISSVYISPQVERLFGYTPEEWLGDPELWVRRLHPDDRDRVVEASHRSDRDGVAFREEYRTYAKDGHLVWVRDESVPVTQDAGRGPTLMQGVIYDITAQKEAEARLQEAENRFRTIVERVPAVAYVWDAADTPGEAPAAYISPQIERLLGFTADAWLQDPTLWSRRLHPGDLPEVMQGWAQAIADDLPFTAEYRIRRADGNEIWLRDEAIPVATGERGRAVYQGVMIDVTEHRAAQDRLREAEERYRTLVEGLPAVVYIDAADEMATALYVSPQYERLTGYTPAERLAEPDLWLRMLHEEDRDRVLAESDRGNETGEPFDIEYRLVRADGGLVWVHDHAFMVDLPGGRKAWQGVLTDVTERQAALEGLGRHDQVLRATAFAAERFLHANGWEDALDEVLPQLGRAVDASRAYVYRNHDDGGELLMSQCAEWVAPGVLPTIDDPSNQSFPYASGFARWQELLSTGQVVHGPVSAHPDPERFDAESEDVWSLCVVPIRAADGWWGFMGFDDCVDPREWTNAEIEALRVAADTLGASIDRRSGDRRLAETQARYRTLIEQIPAVTYMETADSHGANLYISPQVEAVFGYTAEEWDLDVWSEALHPDDRARVLAEDTRTNETGEPFDVEYRLITRDGRVVWVLDQAVLLRDDRGVPLYWQGVRFDMTDRKEAEQHLRDAEERFRAIVEHVPSAIYLDAADDSMQTVYISPQVELITGITPAEWTADPDAWAKAIDPGDRDRVLLGYLEAVRARRPWSDEYRIRTRDGRQIWVRDETTFLSGDDGAPFLMQGVISDITERKLAEQGLRESEQREREAAERLRALDEMKNTFLAAVSHELRSPLTSILGLSLTLERTPGLSLEDRDDLLVRLSANARKLDRLLKDLLDIDRLNRGIVEPAYRTTDIGELALRTLESLDALADRPIAAEVDSVVLRADPAKVERIVENLVMNAARHTTPDRRIWLRVEAAEGGVLIAVEDDGPGVPEGLRTEIFEPFRQGPTASPHSPGTGIGLSLVARFAHLHGGRAWIQDRVGGGASFRVFLPETPEEVLSRDLEDPSLRVVEAS